MKVKNIGTSTATGVRVRMSPLNASTPTTSHTFTLSLVGGAMASDTVTVNLDSAQTVTLPGCAFLRYERE